MGYIYKITNSVTNKCYIGVTGCEDPEKRWRGHQAAFSQGRGCPALRDAVKKYGIDNFKFQVLIICFDEDRYIYERKYIEKYNSVVPNGYNILDGGEGGGFKGHCHTEKTKEILSNIGKKWFEDSNNQQISKERTLKQMEDMRNSDVNWGDKVKSSEKFKKAVEEGRVGCSGAMKEETKKKISESLKKTYSKGNRIGKKEHQMLMSNALGVCVQQYTAEGVYIKTYMSIAEAARDNDLCKSSIQNVMDKPNRKGGGFIWKRDDTNIIVN